MKNLSIYACNRQMFSDTPLHMGYQLGKVQSVLNISRIDADSGVAIVALNDPVFAAVLLLTVGLPEYRIEQLYLFGFFGTRKFHNYLFSEEKKSSKKTI